MNHRAMKAFIPVWIGLIVVAAPPVIALDRYTWTAEGSNNNWGNSVNWDDQAPGVIPDDPNEEAYFNTWTTDQPIQTTAMSNGLGCLNLATAGWHIHEDSGHWLKFSISGGNGYNALYSQGTGTNTIDCLIEFLDASQNLYTGSGNTVVVAGGFRGSYGPVISSLNPTSIDTGAFRLTAASPSLTGTFFLRQGTVLVEANGALGANGSTINIGGDDYTSNNAYARLLTNAAVAIDKPIRVRTHATNHVVATLGGNQTTGASSFTGPVTLELDTSLRSNNTDGNVVTFSGGISGAAGLTKVGAGTVSLSGTMSYGGATVINEGRLLVSGTTLPGGTNVTLADTSGAQLDLGGTSQSVVSVNGGGSNGGSISLGGGTLTVQNGSYGGAISGNGGLVKNGTGTLTLSGNSNFMGPTQVNNGLLVVGHGNALGGATGTTTVADGAALALQGSIETPEPISVTGLGPGGGGAVRNLSGDNIASGDVTLGGGTLATVASGSLSFSGALSGASGSLTKNGTGTLSLSGKTANTYGGTTTVLAGTMRLDKEGVTAVPGALAIGDGSATAVVALTRAAQIADTAAVSVAHSGSLALGPSNEMIGSLSLSGGTVTSTLGTLQVAGPISYTGGAYSSTVSAAVDLGGASRVFNVADGTQTDDLAMLATVSKGQIEKQGDGRLVLQSTLSKVTGLTVTAGSVIVNGGTGDMVVSVTGGLLGGAGTIGAGGARVNVLPGGTIAPGASIGTLRVLGDVDLGGTALMEINALKTQGDALEVGGKLNFGGILMVANTGGFFHDGQTFDLFNFGTPANQFNLLFLPDPGPGLEWDTSRLYTRGEITVIPEPSAGWLAFAAILLAGINRRRRRD